jgi:hypothetical protein
MPVGTPILPFLAIRALRAPTAAVAGNADVQKLPNSNPK